MTENPSSTRGNATDTGQIRSGLNPSESIFILGRRTLPRCLVKLRANNGAVYNMVRINKINKINEKWGEAIQRKKTPKGLLRHQFLTIIVHVKL